MDIKAYISSGIIEAYVMGLASEEEMRILECIQKHNPEVRQAVVDAQQTLEDFASKQAIAPPPELKNAIWAKISSEEQEEIKDLVETVEPVTTTLYPAQNIESNTPELVEVVKPEATPLYPSQTLENNKSSLKWFAAAAAILLVASVTLNLYLNSTQSDIKNQLAAITETQKKNEIAYAELKERWDVVSKPTVRTIPLLGVEKHPDMKAMVYFDQEVKEVYLTLENLPVAPQDKQYQLWAIVDGKPVSLGVFDQKADAKVQKMVAVDAAQAFAITLEKKGGSPTPTMDQMYVMGKV